MFLVAAEYTWTGAGGDDHGWRTPANWGRADNKYPVSGDRAIFPENCNAEVELGATNNYEAVNQLKVLAGAFVRFYAADPTAETRLDLKSAWEVDNAGNTIEFDHIRVDGDKALVLGNGAVLTVKNSSDLRLGNTTVKKAARVSVLSGSIVSSGWIDADSSVGTLLAVDNATWTANGEFAFKNTATNLLSNGAMMKISTNLSINGPNTLLSIDNAALLVKGAANLGTATPGGGRILFKGDNPMLKSISGSEFRDGVNSANMTSHIDFDFVVPEGGFAAPPIQWMGQQAFRNNGNSPNGYFRFNVLPSSPALSAGTQTDCILFYSLSGITRTKASNGDTSTATLRFADMTGETEATSDGDAKTIWATIGSGAAATSTATGPGCLLNYHSTKVDRNVITVSGRVSALASNGDATHVELWCGTADNAATMEYVATVVPESAPSRISTTFSTPEDNGEVTYYFQWRLFDIGAGGVTNYTDVSDAFSAATKDTTTYTWQAVNGDWNGDWHDTAHWSSDRVSARGYPYSGNSTAVFPVGQAIVVTISANEFVGTLELNATKDLLDAANAQGVDVTFKGASETGTNCVLSVSTLFNVYSPLGVITLDNAAIKVNNGDIKPIGGKKVRLVNGANFYSQTWQLYEGGVIELSGKSVANINALYIGHTDSTVSIDDSRLSIRGESNFGAKSTGGAFIFKGANPVLYFASNQNALFFAGNQASKMVFDVLAEGYDEPVIQCTSSMSINNFFRQNGKTSASLTLSVADDSPFYSTVGTLDQPLIAWSGTKAIDTSNLRYAEVADGGYFMLGTSATSDYGFEDVASFSDTAKSLGVHLVSVAHNRRLTVASDASQPLDGYSPALGDNNGYSADDSVELSAPTGVTSNDVHYTCTGYTLVEYAAGDAATVVSTTTVMDGTRSFNYIFPAGRAQITWHYVESYPVTATVVNDAGGTVAKSADYTTATSPVTLTASTVTDGMEFQYWYGDVPYENRYDNPLTISGDRMKNVTAFFGATAANGAMRLLSYNGNVGKEWFDTTAWTGGVIPGTNDTAVLLNTSTYNLHQSQNKGRIIAPSFVAVGNLVVSNAALFVGARYARFDGSTYNSSNPAQYWWTDQHGNGIYEIAIGYDFARTEPVGLDVFGDVILDSRDRAYSNGNSGGVVFIGGTQSSCNTRVNVAGDLDIVNGAFQVVAGYPFDFVPDSSTAVDRGFISFAHPEAFFRGGNYLRVAGKTSIRTPTATKTYNFLHVVNDFRTGAAVWLDLQDVEIGEDAYITSYFGGYGKFNSAGEPTSSNYSTCPGGHQVADTYDGGCHGGLGGKGNGAGDGYDNPTEMATTYDYELTPIYPGNANGGNSNTRGAGSIRLDCRTLNLGGGLLATGHSAGKGGSAGGSIWVICDTFNAGDNCKVFADGGNKNCGGGGGRIAICEGLTDEQVTNLWATHEAPAGVTVTDLADKLQSRTTVAGGTGVVGKYSKGYPGTAFYLVNTAGKRTLTVAGNPANLGSPTPAYGPQIYDDGNVVSIVAPEAAFVSDDNRSRRVAVGYSLTDTETGAVLVDEDKTYDTLTITGDWTLTWKLTTLQHAIDIGVATAGGSLVTNTIGAAGEIWQGDSSALSVTAVPAVGWRFVGWTGDINEAAQYSATFATNVTGGLAVRAVFVADANGTATWTGEGDGTSFLDAANWSIGKVPGPKNDVVIGGDVSVTGAVGLVFNVKSLTVSAGATLAILPEGTYSTREENPHVYPKTVALYDLHDCGLVASGDISVAGTLVVGSRHSLAKATVAAGGAFTISAGASVTMNGGYDDVLIGATAMPALWRNYGAVASSGGMMTVNGMLSIYGDSLSGSPVKVAANRLVVGATGILNSDGGGWCWKNFHGAELTYSLGGVVGNNYNGGAYGGFGGGYNNTPANVTDYGNKKTYGDALRPYLPGSPGGNDDGKRFGGGALRIEVTGSLLNNGQIGAKGKNSGGSCGGGSGGSVWISCSKFVNAAGAMVSADGGNNTSNGGGGGGGRILVCERLDAEKINALYTTGVVPEKVTATEITDANLAEFSAGTISADGGTNVNNSASYPCWSGTAGSIWWLRGRALGTSIKVR